ncbi:hypothetical protein [Rufibacter hautae]|uniref:Lipoprotein n=1 Tax=Rufibacter hautae TaxID=2595005 RepID=A0A5B6THP9_9BACT|nr:hypothetical protein [Rufibacter hautae]KAA3440192.1 hypothetical protein FOA19_05885 [Rufibacter hautae]
MKRSSLVLIAFYLSFGCSEKVNSESNPKTIKTETAKKTESTEQSYQTPADSLRSYEFKDYRTVKLTDPIYEDFDGDSVKDTAVFTSRKQKAGVIIRSGKSNKEYVIGCGKEFEEMSDDFSWVDSWGVVKDKETFEIIIENAEIVGERKFILDNPSIFVMKHENGGIITFKNGHYEWVHQSD